MSERIYNVLFLCTGNTARSILAESILRKDGRRNFRAFSAGSQPKGTVNPFAIKVLNRLEYPTDELRSKSWQEFARSDAPVMDFVFTVCDNAAGEVLSGLAGTADDGALGHRRPGGGRGDGHREGSGLRSGISLSQESNLRLHESAAGKHRPAVAWDSAARYRPH